MNSESIRRQLQQTIEDFTFSRREKQDLRQLIAEEGLGPNDIVTIRSMAFQMAQEFCDHRALAWLDGITHVLASTLKETQESAQQEVLFSPRDDCAARIQSMIRGATSAIDICVFTITDDGIAAEILQAHKRGKRVRIVSDNEKADDRGSDIFHLIESGVPTALDRDGHMHHKFAVFDRARSITGSYNWTRGAARFNHENLLISHDPIVSKALLSEFEQLWTRYSD